MLQFTIYLFGCKYKQKKSFINNICQIFGKSHYDIKLCYMYCSEAEKTSHQREIGIIIKCISKLLIMRFVKGIDNHIRMRE